MSIKIPHLKDTTVNESCKVLLDGIEATFRDDNNILLIGNGFDIALGKKTSNKSDTSKLFFRDRTNLNKYRMNRYTIKSL